MNNKELDYIPYIEYDNKINDSFDTHTIQVPIQVNMLLQLPNVSHKYNSIEQNDEYVNKCNILVFFKNIVKKLFM